MEVDCCWLFFQQYWQQGWVFEEIQVDVVQVCWWFGVEFGEQWFQVVQLGVFVGWVGLFWVVVEQVDVEWFVGQFVYFVDQCLVFFGGVIGDGD